MVTTFHSRSILSGFLQLPLLGAQAEQQVVTNPRPQVPEQVRKFQMETQESRI